jgi:hypothetical protein
MMVFIKDEEEWIQTMIDHPDNSTRFPPRLVYLRLPSLSYVVLLNTETVFYTH